MKHSSLVSANDRRADAAASSKPESILDFRGLCFLEAILAPQIKKLGEVRGSG